MFEVKVIEKQQQNNQIKITCNYQYYYIYVEALKAVIYNCKVISEI